MLPITERLNQIYDLVATDDFLQCSGISNEIAFYIFDYSPDQELLVREHIGFLVNRLRNQAKINIAEINLFKLLVDHLKERNLLERSYQLEINKGIDQLEKAIRAPLKAENLVKMMSSVIDPDHHDLVLVHGIGNSWPLARTHLLLNNLQPVMKATPLVLFYPGIYDGQSFRLFNKLQSNCYYRAFRLVP